MDIDVLVVGAGLSGAVIAEQFATKLNKRVLVIDKRDHVGGNCYDYVDSETNILLSKYGAHLFHTNDEGVWKYVNKFCNWVRYEHKVVARVGDRLVPVPVNMETINVLCNQHLDTVEKTKRWLHSQQITSTEPPQNSKDVALSRVGPVLYEQLFKPYTIKQWGRDPKELDPSVLARIPVRYDNDPRYFSDTYQAIPEKGYTYFFEKLLDHPNITVQLNTEFQPNVFNYTLLIFTGPIDSYFQSSGLPTLKYRSLRFEIERYKNVGYVQPHFVVNTPSLDIPSTRSIEYKHLPYNQTSTDSIVIREYPTDEGEPYYPIPTKQTEDIYNQYKALADKETLHGVHFIGRLANYKYFNMDQAIANSLQYFNTHFTAILPGDTTYEFLHAEGKSMYQPDLPRHVGQTLYN
jgi:UDP-galactopyranose mutase